MALLMNNGAKELWYIGRSNAIIYWDLGVGKTDNVGWTQYPYSTSSVTKNNLKLINSFASKNDCNNMLIWGCSRVLPFMYNGICWENCTWYVFYVDGLEKM